jgi:Beta-lactamase
MRKINFLLLLLQCLSAATAQQPYSKAVNEQIARVETNLSGGMVIDGKMYTLSERMKHYNVSGLSVAVIVAILQLAQQGKLDLYQDINQYLVNWKFPYDTVSHGKKITTAQLLSHTAGLGVHGFPGYQRDSAIAAVTDILDGRAPSTMRTS